MVAATIAAVLYIALNGPDQPPTIRREPSRGKERRERRAEALAGRSETEAAMEGPATPGPPVGISGAPALAVPDSDVMRLRVLPARANSVGARIRSSIVLVVLVAILGALLALAVGGLALGLTLLLRSATA